MIDLANKLLTYLTFFSHLFLLLALSSLFLKKIRDKIFPVIKERALLLAFIVSLFSVLGSLYYSEIVGYPPCELCWYQRIFMYPQVIILGLGMARKELKAICYSLPLLFAGAIISIYHNYIYYNSLGSSFCGIDGTVSCTTKYITELGYITIPLMALSAFVLMISFLLIYKHYPKNESPN